ncbi:hypothetical protein FIBSPDRAFT_877695 [Athelia psychrophila]|uniref:Uncharacterized protein n=1 Tax=Athelia psychrophila TaxID=1759441 RepID=A0A167VRJ3_9AGAM|nr:hypothetical protein FIBSPDRAFT_877695 [Fibularhizoctonia sp. CBS 109695]
MSPLHSIAITTKESDRCNRSQFAELVLAKKVVRVRKLTEAMSSWVFHRFIALLPFFWI